MEHIDILIAVLSWLWWFIHLMAYRAVREWPRYIQSVWRVGLVTLPILGGIAVSGPTGLLSSYLVLMFVAVIGMWGGTGCVFWGGVLCPAWTERQGDGGATQPPVSNTPHLSQFV